MDNILIPSLNLQNKRLILLALVVIFICVIITLFVIFNHSNGDSSEPSSSQPLIHERVESVFEPRPSYEPIPVPLPVNDLRLSQDDMMNATLLSKEKNIIEKLKNKIIKLQHPSISTNFRLYGNLTADGRILLFDHNGACVAEFKMDGEFLSSNISGKTFSHRLASKSKSYHFVVENYKIFLNGIELGELHGQQDVQFIKIDDKEIQDIQLMEIDPSISLFDIAQKSIF